MSQPPAHCFHCKYARATDTGLSCSHPDFERDGRPEVPIKGRAEFCPDISKAQKDAEVIQKFMAGTRIPRIGKRMKVSEDVIEQTIRFYVEELEKRIAEFEKGGYS